MTGAQKRSLLRRTHSWLGVVVSLFVLVAAGSGILLQHPTWLGTGEDRALCLAVDPADSRRMLRGTTWGVEVSDDGGLQWREAPMLAPPNDVARILFAPSPGVVYALGSQSMVVSADGGRIWQEFPGPRAEILLGAQFLDLTVAPDGALELLTTVGQYHWAAGEGWRSVGTPVAVKRGAHRWLHDLHTGHLGGAWGRRVVETGGWGLILITLSGLVLYLRAGTRKTR